MFPLGGGWGWSCVAQFGPFVWLSVLSLVGMFLFQDLGWGLKRQKKQNS